MQSLCFFVYLCFVLPVVELEFHYRCLRVMRRIRKFCEKRQLASSCPSIRKEKLGSHWTDFHEILYLSIFRKSVEKIQVLLLSEKKNNNGYIT